MRRVIAIALLSTACGTSQAQEPAERPTEAAATTSSPPTGSLVWNTYYYVASEADYSGSPSATLFDATCAPMAQVNEAFLNAVCIEGTGRLADGRAINVDETCDCAARCPNGSRVCWRALDASAPWGLGNRENALEPFVSWATDRSVIPSGEVVYAPEWDGVEIPVVDGLGGFVHDGCFRADDVGGAIDGDHVDVFVGTRSMWRAMEGVRPTRSRQHAQVGSPRCAHLRR
ncbi:MAG: hypothetical protein H6719_17705 [Sandaracinaceae bacterium]|nr:hypothetical protein [Sandaracinaceae bacterium]